MHWLIDSLVHLFADSLISWLFDAFIHWVTGSSTRWFTGSLIVDSLAHWFIDSLIGWLAGSLVIFSRCFIDSLLWFADSFIHEFIGSLVQRFIGSSVHRFRFISSPNHWFTDSLLADSLHHRLSDSLVHWFTDSLVHRLTNSLIHWFTGSFGQLCMDSFMSLAPQPSFAPLLMHFTASFNSCCFASQTFSYRPSSSYSCFNFRSFRPGAGQALPGKCYPFSLRLSLHLSDMILVVMRAYLHYQHIHLEWICNFSSSPVIKHQELHSSFILVYYPSSWHLPFHPFLIYFLLLLGHTVV